MMLHRSGIDQALEALDPSRLDGFPHVFYLEGGPCVVFGVLNSVMEKKTSKSA